MHLGLLTTTGVNGNEEDTTPAFEVSLTSWLPNLGFEPSIIEQYSTVCVTHIDKECFISASGYEWVRGIDHELLFASKVAGCWRQFNSYWHYQNTCSSLRRTSVHQIMSLATVIPAEVNGWAH